MKRRIIILLCAALCGLAFFNYFEHYLEGVEILPVNAWWASPFILLLLSIAVVPFINRHWWEKYYPAFAAVLGIVVVLFYAFSLNNLPRLFLTLYEYVSFITIIGSLFVVAGGIHMKLRGKSSPWENIVLLGSGAVISNVVGTTGASMILIGPYLRVNRSRIRPYHVVFFIFLVSNIGGALTPIGDPPLFLGYLKGVPFFWLVGKAWHVWLFTVALVLTTFYVIDSRSFRHESTKEQLRSHVPDEPEVTGLQNLVFLIIILGAVFVERPIMVREVLMWCAAFGSYYTTRPEIHRKNEFNFLPIREVAILFAGIFATMIPALDWLELNAGAIGIVTPGQYFWATGALSGFLDNAPTYLNFMSASFGLHGANLDNSVHMQLMLGLSSPAQAGLSNPLQEGAMSLGLESWRYIQAISLGAVFFGACTYIGNGPNFMVKSIAEQKGVQCPSFVGYVTNFSIPILVPIFAIVWFVFIH